MRKRQETGPLPISRLGIETLSVIDDSVSVIVQATLLDGRCQFEVPLCGCLPGLAAIFTDNEANKREVAALLRVDGSDIAVSGAGIIKGCYHVLPAIRGSHGMTGQIKFLQTNGSSPRNFNCLSVRRLRECMCLIIFSSRVTYHDMFTPPLSLRMRMKTGLSSERTRRITQCTEVFFSGQGKMGLRSVPPTRYGWKPAGLFARRLELLLIQYAASAVAFPLPAYKARCASGKEAQEVRVLENVQEETGL